MIPSTLSSRLILHLILRRRLMSAVGSVSRCTPRGNRTCLLVDMGGNMFSIHTMVPGRTVVPRVIVIRISSLVLWVSILLRNWVGELLESTLPS